MNKFGKTYSRIDNKLLAGSIQYTPTPVKMFGFSQVFMYIKSNLNILVPVWDKSDHYEVVLLLVLSSVICQPNHGIKRRMDRN